MKAYWPFLLAAVLAGALVTLYLMGWYGAAWVLTVLMIAFPLLYVLVAIVWIELRKRWPGKGKAAPNKTPPPA